MNTTNHLEAKFIRSGSRPNSLLGGPFRLRNLSKSQFLITLSTPVRLMRPVDLPFHSRLPVLTVFTGPTISWRESLTTFTDFLQIRAIQNTFQSSSSNVILVCVDPRMRVIVWNLIIIARNNIDTYMRLLKNFCVSINLKFWMHRYKYFYGKLILMF